MLCINIQLFAGYGQTVQLDVKNSNLAGVLREIKKQTGYDFILTGDLLTKSRPVTIKSEGKSLKEVLDLIFADQPLLTYELADKDIIISGKTDPAGRSNSNQQRMLTGTVLNEAGALLEGASVRIKHTQIAAKTSSDGRFRLTAPNEQTATLVVTYLGYKTKELAASDGIIIRLEPQDQTLEEVVAVGYGTVKRRDLTGSVASVNMEKVRDVPFTSIDQALTGQAAGVQVVQADGSPGGVAKIRIRGGTSLMGGNDPLYIIDGVQVTVQNRYAESSAELVNPIDNFGSDSRNSAVSGSFARGLNSLAGLNINDIESIDILKDASATAIYGSRAANGVVIITTKRGKKDQKPTLEANYYHGFSVEQPLQVLSRDQYLMVMREANQNLYNAMLASGNPITEEQHQDFNNRLNDPNYYGTANTSWLDYVTRTGQADNADLSIRGGGNASRYFISLGYNGTKGTVEGTDFTRMTGKISLDNDITDKLRILGTLNYGYTVNNITNGLYTQSLFAPPTYPAYNEEGGIFRYSGSTLGGSDYQGFQNPLVLLNGINRARTNALLGSVSAEYRILPSLTFRSIASINYNSVHQRNYAPSDVLITASNGVGSSNFGTGFQAQSEDTDAFFENTLTWEQELGTEHRINAVVGTTWQKTRMQRFGVTAQGYPDDNVLNNLSSASLVTAAEGVSGQNSLLSFYLRANYAFKERYLFTFTGRSDASSKFPLQNRTGYFPSGGIAWRISDEPFMQSAEWLNELKLRASAGYTGTQNIGDYMFYTLFSPYAYGGANAMVPTQLGNSNIKWESTLQKDVGIDLSLFHSRFMLSVGLYEKQTNDILFTTNVAPSSAYNSVIANLASIRNRGLEIDFRTTFVDKPAFSWIGAYNMSFNRSLVTNVNRDFTNPANANEFNLGNAIIREEQPIGLLYGKVFEGIIQNEEQAEDYRERYVLHTYFDPYLGVGDPMYRISEGENFHDNNVIGYAEPKFYGGYSNTLRYKGLSLITLFTFAYGGDVLYLGDIQNQSVGNRANKTTDVLKRWTPDNPSATRPRLIYGGNSTTYTSSSAVYDASFFKLRTMTLTYQLPSRILQQWRLPNATVYGSATNVFTITNYPGADPEVSNDPYSLINGTNDPGTYPAVRQYTIGFRFGL
ncbi:SusC/RagA family TonB-linked outer membrane protein [Parapedobacter tibetensis]|uniref:SusC/RagA family TonB-linked outer membrane protein n=1 Tax=Parapedobacter tibetensis TaxID=2972951 RepID=UPI00214D69FA|nr:TonB-dependent receptor [Parapedobacter tibetensis]